MLLGSQFLGDCRAARSQPHRDQRRRALSWDVGGTRSRLQQARESWHDGPL